MSERSEADDLGVRRKAVTKLTGRKRRLVLETPYVTRGRAVVVLVDASG
jgi:hypothetical protein